jgi:hypothetical protein
LKSGASAAKHKTVLGPGFDRKPGPFSARGDDQRPGSDAPEQRLYKSAPVGYGATALPESWLSFSPELFVFMRRSRIS